MKTRKNKFTNGLALLLILWMSVWDFWYFFNQPLNNTPHLSVLRLIEVIAFIVGAIFSRGLVWRPLRYLCLLLSFNLLADISNKMQLIGNWIFGPLGVLGFIFFILSLRAIKALSANSPPRSV